MIRGLYIILKLGGQHPQVKKLKNKHAIFRGMIEPHGTRIALVPSVAYFTPFIAFCISRVSQFIHEPESDFIYGQSLTVKLYIYTPSGKLIYRP